MGMVTRPKSASEIARMIVDDLFVNQLGEQADRLVLWVDATDRILGGWAKVAIFHRIEKILREHGR
jgi:hypothetical protein